MTYGGRQRKKNQAVEWSVLELGSKYGRVLESCLPMMRNLLRLLLILLGMVIFHG